MVLGARVAGAKLRVNNLTAREGLIVGANEALRWNVSSTISPNPFINPAKSLIQKTFFFLKLHLDPKLSL
jgi:hypothetical protein